MINGRFPAPPFWLKSVLLVGFCGSLLLFAGVLRSRQTKSTEPRIHFIQDMDNQVKYKTQHSSDVFADGRVSRPHVVGTVARGQLAEDDLLNRGYSDTVNPDGTFGQPTFLRGFPVTVDDKLLHRGQLKFNTYCLPCHGADGHGNGPINVRAVQLASNPQTAGQMAWTPPSDLTDEIRRNREDGHIYNTVVNGIRNMGAYGSMIQDPYDRWAVVAYVRALQTRQALLPQQAAPEGNTSPAATQPTTQQASR